MSVKGLMTTKEKAEAIQSLIEDCQLRGMYGSIVIGIDGGEVRTVDLKEHMKISDLPKRHPQKKVVIVRKGAVHGNEEDNANSNSQEDK